MWEEFKVNVVEVNIVEPIILILPFVVVTNQLCLSCVGGDGKQYKLILKRDGSVYLNTITHSMKLKAHGWKLMTEVKKLS